MMENKIENLFKEEIIKEITNFKKYNGLHCFFKCSEFDIAQWLALLLL